jgi:hypothetical protein
MEEKIYENIFHENRPTENYIRDAEDYYYAEMRWRNYEKCRLWSSEL